MRVLENPTLRCLQAPKDNFYKTDGLTTPGSRYQIQMSKKYQKKKFDAKKLQIKNLLILYL